MDILVILKNFLDAQQRLTAFPAKRKMKLYALYYLATKIEAGVIYTEMDINSLIGQWHTFNDPATLRRELYNNRFIDRKPNCSAYWLDENAPKLEELESLL